MGRHNEGLRKMPTEILAIRESEGGVTFSIRVLPRSSRSEIAGIQESALRIRITAPPVEGLANEECIRLLAKKLHIAKSRISLIAGQQSRNKTVRIEGLKRKDIEALI